MENHDDDDYCPYIDACYFKRTVLKDYDDFCVQDFTGCARFKRGCLRGINDVPNEMKPIDYGNI